jgi:ubiquinone/menaquinone biosynthesis C-methylase UbiE
VAAFLLFVPSSTGCSERKGDVQANGQAAPVQRESVKPGINDRFQNPDVDEFVRSFEAESREIYAQREAIVAELELRPGMDVADIGAGTGFFTILFARAVGPDGKVYGVDIAENFVQHIRELAEREGLGNVHGVVNREDSVDLPAGSIDLAFICDTYHHFEYPEPTLASIHKALRPGGALVIVDFKRIEGTSREWVLNHVRAGQEVTTQEIERAGFELVDDGADIRYLDENYLIRFRRKP